MFETKQMDFYWIYDIPSWQLAAIIVGALVGFNLTGLGLLRHSIVKRIIPQAHNDIVSYYLSSATAVYGITLGLIAVATWSTFSETDKTVGQEAAAVAALYRDLNSYPSPDRELLVAKLKEYTRYVIQEAWPLQRKGIIPKDGTTRITEVQQVLYRFQPKNESQSIIHAEAIRQFNHLIELRRQRLQSVNSGLPAILWWVIVSGALINIVITWFFRTDQFRVHLLMSILFSALLGSLIFLIAATDNPYRGELSVGPDAFVLVMDSLMR